MKVNNLSLSFPVFFKSSLFLIFNYQPTHENLCFMLSMSKLTFKLTFKMFEKLQFLIVLINIMDTLNVDWTTDLLLTRKILYIFF